ncbi:MAG: type II toxin-antitoxin system VapC family toxin [Promethearchaeota archaeon]
MNLGILLDTGFIFALKDENDPYHLQAIKLFKNINWDDLSPVITNNLVINEVLTLAVYRSLGNKKILEALKNLVWGTEKFFQVLEVPFENYEAVLKILIQYISPKKLLSFVDASLIYSAKLLKYNKIISFDSHFDGILTRFLNN